MENKYTVYLPFDGTEGCLHLKHVDTIKLNQVVVNCNQLVDVLERMGGVFTTSFALMMSKHYLGLKESAQIALQ